jgi:hypothetical protein
MSCTNQQRYWLYTVATKSRAFTPSKIPPVGYVLLSSYKATLFTPVLVLINFDSKKIFGLVCNRPDGIYTSMKEG